ncbi:MAG: hypothetical protein IJX67_11465 [Oscillospiraceae bacterium]|nr:hypothetical protein [Oscillospiraceae bacterium]
MKLWKDCVLFYLGGMVYMIMEFAFRGWSHGSMFLAGGLCFLLIGKLERQDPKLPLPWRLAFGALIITMVELAAGLIFNRTYGVWDYRDEPLNFYGQICLPFCLLWIPVSYGAMWLYDFSEKQVKI